MGSRKQGKHLNTAHQSQASSRSLSYGAPRANPAHAPIQTLQFGPNPDAPAPPQCSEPSCTRPCYGEGLCKSHKDLHWARSQDG